MLSGLQVTVVGAGIAGLGVAVALARRGARVTVLEQAPAVREFGAGLQISPNGAAVLRGLGLGEALARISLPALAVELRDGRQGDLVLRLDLARLRPGQRYGFVHRADLLGMLADAAVAAGVSIETGAEVVRVVPGPQVSVIGMADGSERRPGLLIGADGLHSVVRKALNGADQARFSGQVAWRAVIAAEAGAAPVATVLMGPGRHLVSYPMRSGTLRNIVAVEERRDWVAEGWQHRDDPAHLRAAFAGFAPEAQRWLEQVECTHLWGLFLHPVASCWQRPGVAILGDAAHPTLPFLAQGANMALEDAWVLAECLAQGRGLERFQAQRLARTRRIVAAAARNARSYHLRGPVRAAAHLGLKLIGATRPGLMLQRFDWLYGHDVTA